MEAFMARAAGEKPPGMGYMGCPGLRKRDTLSIELCLFTLPDCWVLLTTIQEDV